LQFFAPLDTKISSIHARASAILCGRPRGKTQFFGLVLSFALSLAVFDPPSLHAQADTQPPVIVAFSPSPGANGQAVNTNVTATFSEGIQPASASFTLRDSSNTIVSANISYDASSHTVTLDPTTDLIASHTYTATLSGALDLSGNPMTTP